MTITPIKPENHINATTNKLPIVDCVARARIPTTNGPEIFLHLYKNNQDDKEHLAIVFGEDIRSRSLFKRKTPHESQKDRMIRGAYCGKLYPGRNIADEYRDPKTNELLEKLYFDKESGELLSPTNTTTWDSQNPTVVRIHSECYTGETAWSARCDCGEQFDRAGEYITNVNGGNGHGVIVYLRQEGRGIGLSEKLKAYNLQDLGADTVQANLLLKHPADARDFSIGISILVDLGIHNVKLLTNNPDKINQVEYPPLVHVVQRIPMIPLSWTDSEKGVHSKEVDGYLRTKIVKMGHLLNEPIKLHERK